MYKRTAARGIALFLAISASSGAFAVQVLQFANLLYNSEAVVPGVTQTDVTLNIYTGSSILCDVRIVTYGTAVTFQPGVTGSNNGHTTCTSSQLITSISATPITASAATGSVYGTTPITYTVSNPSSITQVSISQQPEDSSDYSPIFDATNGTVATPGIAIVG